MVQLVKVNSNEENILDRLIQFYIYEFTRFRKDIVLEEAEGDSPNVIEEFFVIRKYHGKGVGRVGAQKLFSMFPGKWHVVEIENNYPSQAFWRKTIKEYTSDTFTDRYDEHRRSIQEFDTAKLP